MRPSQEQKIRLIAHGGWSSHFKENTRESFEGALPFKPEGIEMDVVLFDGELYCYHPEGQTSDETIERELRELQQSGANLSERSLENLLPQLLKHSECILLDLKQKDSSVVPKILMALSKLDIQPGQVVIGARDQEKLQLFAPYKATYRILSLDQDPDSYPAYIQAGAEIIRLFDSQITPERIEAIHQLGAQVWVTPGGGKTATGPRTAGQITPERLRELQDLGIDGVLVNDISMARSVIPR